ncbi:MAG: right-handed parallel beta-helix repeat-containing protein, partial [Candidatus Sulfotelmatobacter sp.]
EAVAVASRRQFLSPLPSATTPFLAHPIFLLYPQYRPEIRSPDISVIDNIVKNNSGGGINMDGVQHILVRNSDPNTGSFGNGYSGIEIGHSSSTFRTTEWITVDSAITTGNGQYGIWSDTSNTTPTQPVDHLTIENSCLSDNILGSTYLVNLGSNVTIKNNQVSGCGPK